MSGAELLPHSGISRLVLGLLWITVITTLATYSATLMSYLTVEIRRLPFTSLKQAIQSPQFKIWMNTKSIYAEMFKVSFIVFIDGYYCFDTSNTRLHHAWHPFHFRQYALLFMRSFMIITVGETHPFNYKVHEAPQTVLITSGLYIGIRWSAITAVIARCSITLYYIHHCSDWSRIPIRIWIHKRHPISRLGCPLLGFQRKLVAL